MDPFSFLVESQPWCTSPAPALNFSAPGTSLSTACAVVATPTPSSYHAGPDPAAISNADEFAFMTDLDDESLWAGLPWPWSDGSLWVGLPWSWSEESAALILEPQPHQVENERSLNGSNAETHAVPPLVSRSATSSKWPNFVCLIRACHRFSQAAAARFRTKVPEGPIKLFKGVMEKKGKFVCETRVMKKIQVEKKCTVKKVWLGTYQTPAQAARALDVGKYFFNAKETKTFFDPKIETMLSTLSQQLLAQPLHLLVHKVKQIAQYYGVHGTLP